MIMSDSGPLIFEREGAVARLTLNRPTVGNSIDVPMTKAILEAAIACDEDPSIRCVLLTGAGRLFCAGGDVASFAAAGEAIPALLKELTAYLHMAIARFARMNKPLVTAINGAAAGAGFSLAILGDIAIASRSASFTLAYGLLGLSPDGGSTWLLPRLIGLRRAQELVLMNERLTAEQAATLGLITRVVDDAEMMNEACALAAKLAASATPAIGKVRNLLLTSFGTSLETQMENEARAIAEVSLTPQGREGVNAFLAKRKPNFEDPPN